jgi:hypothetical protein
LRHLLLCSVCKLILLLALRLAACSFPETYKRIASVDLHVPDTVSKEAKDLIVRVRIFAPSHQAPSEHRADIQSSRADLELTAAAEGPGEALATDRGCEAPVDPQVQEEGDVGRRFGERRRLKGRATFCAFSLPLSFHPIRLCPAALPFRAWIHATGRAPHLPSMTILLFYVVRGSSRDGHNMAEDGRTKAAR